jgi:hypothetical protein
MKRKPGPVISFESMFRRVARKAARKTAARNKRAREQEIERRAVARLMASGERPLTPPPPDVMPRATAHGPRPRRYHATGLLKRRFGG